MTVDTWPGPRKPSRRRSGDSRMALIGGTIVTWLHSTLKLVFFAVGFETTAPSTAVTLLQARQLGVTAVEGAVVSKPTAKNTTSRSGVSVAMRSASSGE